MARCHLGVSNASWTQKLKLFTKVTGRYRVHRRAHEYASATVWRTAKGDFDSKHFNAAVKNTHAAAFETFGVQALVQMIYVQKYALSTLDVVIAYVCDCPTFTSPHHRIAETKQLAIMCECAWGSEGILVGHGAYNAHRIEEGCKVRFCSAKSAFHFDLEELTAANFQGYQQVGERGCVQFEQPCDTLQHCGDMVP
jgi:hypothetical protein